MFIMILLYTFEKTKFGRVNGGFDKVDITKVNSVRYYNNY